MKRYLTHVAIKEEDGCDTITQVDYINQKNIKYRVGGGSKKQRLAIDLDLSQPFSKLIHKLAKAFWKGRYGNEIDTIFVGDINIKYDEKTHEPIAFALKLRCNCVGASFGEHPLSLLPSPEPIHVSGFSEDILKLSELILFELDSWQKDINAQMELDLGVDELEIKRSKMAA